MTVSFDDIVEMHLRYLENSPSIRRRRRKEFLMALAVICTVTLVVGKPALWVRACLSAGAGVVFAFAYYVTFRPTWRRKLKRDLRDQLGGDGPFAYTIVVNQGDVCIEWRRNQRRFDLGDLTRIVESPAATDFWFEQTAMFSIPADAFTSTEERVDFETTIRERAIANGGLS